MPPENISVEERPQNLGRVLYNIFAPHGDFVGRPYRLRFKPFALSQLVSGSIPLVILAMNGSATVRAIALIILGIKISFGAVLTAFIVTRFFPVMVNQGAIRARNFWGMARVVPFEEMSKVDPIRWLIFTPFARITTVRGRNWVWLPLFLVRQKEFEAEVLATAPEDNPLRLYFER